VHFVDHVMVESVGCILKKGCSVDVHGCTLEGITVGPGATGRRRGHEVHSLHWVVVIGEIN